MRASGRSTLLMTRITGSRASSALRSTKRVCGSGPSEASTSSSTPSTIVSPRSTSPPKSAWPGVSTMLSFTPPWRTAVFLARIVMPFSRSRSIESSTRSATSWLARNAPDCHSIASTSVVLPWSTWATIATLRRSSRATSIVPPEASGGRSQSAERAGSASVDPPDDPPAAVALHVDAVLEVRGPAVTLDRVRHQHEVVDPALADLVARRGAAHEPRRRPDVDRLERDRAEAGAARRRGAAHEVALEVDLGAALASALDELRVDAI